MPNDLQPELFAPIPAAVVATPVIDVRPRWRRPRVSAAQIAALEARLRGRGWQQRADLDLGERELRLIAEASDGAILSSPGSAGVRHFDDASEAEWDRADIAFTNQINAMIRRRNAYRRRRQRVQRSRVRFV